MNPVAPKRRPMAEINVVPYIDVMLVLLIIFMVTAPMLVQTVPVELPKVDAKPSQITPDDQYLIVSINQKGLYFIEKSDDNPQAMTKADIVEYMVKVVQQAPKTQIMIRGDERVPYGSVVGLMGALQARGIQRVGLVTEAADPKAR